MFGSLRSWLDRRGATLAVAFGGDACRYVSLDDPHCVFQEPSLIVRCLSDGKIILKETSIGVIARETLVCGHAERYEYARMFGDRALADAYVVSRVLRHFRGRAALQVGGVRARRVLVTARPRLLHLIRREFARAFRAAGFKEGRLIDEHLCLADSVGVGRAGAWLIVHVGHCATRLYAWADGELIAHVTTPAVSGQRLATLMCAWMRGHHLLVTSPAAAAKLLAATGYREMWPHTVRGYDLITSRPRTIEPDRDAVLARLQPEFERLAHHCLEPLGVLAARSGPPTRVVLTGAGAQVGGLAEILRRALCRDVAPAPSPGEARIRGLATALNGIRHPAYIPTSTGQAGR